jgi:hypothetical protein
MGTDPLVIQQLVEVLEEFVWLTADDRADLNQAAIESNGAALTPEQELSLLTRIIKVLRAAALHAGDDRMAASLTGDAREVAQRIISKHGSPVDRRSSQRAQQATEIFELIAKGGIEPAPVRPTPIFHGRPVPMVGGFARVRDLELWPENVRLEIHLDHFREQHGRAPDKDELLAIIQGKLVMPGLVKSDDDEFEVGKLARSIAANGVQRPPILDVDGTLLEGNRRLAACYQILDSVEFNSEEKARAEFVFVWRLTKHATDEDREAVIVASNFEPDYKKQWDDYIRAKKIYSEWEARLELEPTATPRRQGEIKKELAHRFGLGPDATVVTRFIKMMEWANEFELFETAERKRDIHAIRHQANRYFQYFDEMAKGVNPGGVAWTLGQDEALKHIAFDLMYEGKLASWMPIRGLKYVPSSAQSRSLLEDALAEPDIETAQDLVEAAIKIARPIPGAGRGDPNPRIEDFVNFLMALPLSAFKTKVTPESRVLLEKALEYVRGVFEAAEATEPA